MTHINLRRTTCYYCDVPEGSLHKRSCPDERCSVCGGQALYCDCDMRGAKRIPFIAWTNICGRCGQISPEFFDVPTKVRQNYVEPGERDRVICCGCWRDIVNLIDGGEFERKHGPAVMLADLHKPIPPADKVGLKRWNEWRDRDNERERINAERDRRMRETTYGWRLEWMDLDPRSTAHYCDYPTKEEAEAAQVVLKEQIGGCGASCISAISSGWKPHGKKDFPLGTAILRMQNDAH